MTTPLVYGAETHQDRDSYTIGQGGREGIILAVSPHLTPQPDLVKLS